MREHRHRQGRHARHHRSGQRAGRAGVNSVHDGQGQIRRDTRGRGHELGREVTARRTSRVTGQFLGHLMGHFTGHFTGQLTRPADKQPLLVEHPLGGQQHPGLESRGGELDLIRADASIGLLQRRKSTLSRKMSRAGEQSFEEPPAATATRLGRIRPGMTGIVRHRCG